MTKTKRKYIKAPDGPRKLLLNLDDDEGKRLDKLVARWDFLSHTVLAMQAMRIGLALIEENPGLILKSRDELASELKTRGVS